MSWSLTVLLKNPQSSQNRMVRSTCSVALFSFSVMPDPPQASVVILLPLSAFYSWQSRKLLSRSVRHKMVLIIPQTLSPVSERFLPFFIFFIFYFSEYRTGSPLAAVLFVCARQTATFVRKTKIVVYFDTRGVVYFCNEPTEDWIISLPPLTAPIGSDRAALDVQYLCNCT